MTIKFSTRETSFEGSVSDKLKYLDKKINIMNYLNEDLERKFGIYFLIGTPYSICVTKADFYTKTFIWVQEIGAYKFEKIYEVEITNMSNDEIIEEILKIKEIYKCTNKNI
jgi:hypothetical protein